MFWGILALVAVYPLDRGGTTGSTIKGVGDKIEKILTSMRASNANVSYQDLKKVCDFYFERRPSRGGDHETYKTPWRGDPRVNIQNRDGKAKPYQVNQVLAAVDKLLLEGK